ncbi:MAG: TraR/DksA family transcriptional regulator [Alphaproteobacteria bacterium]
MVEDPGAALKKFKALLIERRAEVERIIETGEVTHQGEIDRGAMGRLSRMDAMQVQAMDAETERRRTAELHRIDVALSRIEDGEFGACATCGEEIAVKRLENDPAVTQCVGCAGKSGG